MTDINTNATTKTQSNTNTTVINLNFKRIWEQTLNYIKNNQPNILPASFESWIQPLIAVDYHNNIIYLGTDNSFTQEWAENNYLDIINRNLRNVTNGAVTEAKIVLLEEGGVYRPSYNDDNKEENITEDPELSDEMKREEALSRSKAFKDFDGKYTFDNFVVGSSNRFAYTASLAVAESPGKNYNPLFLIGGVGLGKTHLMKAIGHFALQKNPNTKISYFSSETFVNDWIQAIATKTTDKFRNKYRNYDIILIDDVHFLAGKDSCQEELFHTYNSLYDSGCQIILSSDRPLIEIENIEQRLSSRFMSGLTVEIAPPDLETRIAILQRLMKEQNVFVESNDVLFYIANRIDNNVRYLEGSFNQIAARSKLLGEPITMEMATDILKGFLPENAKKTITTELIKKTVSQYYHINNDDMTSKKRTNNIAFPRQVAMYLSRELTDATFEKIGEDFGNRHYSTVIHAYEEIFDRKNSDLSLKKALEEITDSLKRM